MVVGLLHEAMLYRHDASYQHYLAAQRQRLHAAQTAAARLREQQHRDEQLRQEAALVAASSNSGGGAGAGLSAEDALLLAYKNDLRNGLTIEDVLRYLGICFTIAAIVVDCIGKILTNYRSLSSFLSVLHQYSCCRTPQL